MRSAFVSVLSVALMAVAFAQTPVPPTPPGSAPIPPAPPSSSPIPPPPASGPLAPMRSPAVRAAEKAREPVQPDQQRVTRQIRLPLKRPGAAASSPALPAGTVAGAVNDDAAANAAGRR